MPESDPHLARVRNVFEAALTGDAAAGAWTPPLPETIAPLFPAHEIGALLGRGGMGAVYRARQKSLDRLVAIKLLPFELGVQEDFAERFRREATALARLSHPHIVAVHDFGQADDGHYFMVMEYVDGTDLAERLRGGPLAPAEALEIVRQVCDALEFAHAHGVVHRDVKPGNILLDATGRVKVTDFGIAQLAGDEPRTALTATGALLGTPEYVAPEQTQVGAAVDARADVFSVGVMLYELLTGQLPRGVFRPLGQIVPAARSLDRVITRALQSDPAMRYPAVRELRAALVGTAAPRRSRLAMVSVATLLSAVAGVAIWQWWPAALKPMQEKKAPAPFVNSLGLRFVPAGTPGVLFCTTETRVRDFTAFTLARNLPDYPVSVWMNFTGREDAWRAVNATWRTPGFPQTPEHPVVAVPHHEAAAFCDWLTEHERRSGRLGIGEFYRLPTNAEWSVAAGLDADTPEPSGRFPWGSAFPPREAAWNFASEELRRNGDKHTGENAIAGYRDGHAFTAPVGSFAANARGLHDVSGNVWEWTDGDGRGPKATLRGGSWGDGNPDKLDLACRIQHERTLRCYTFGFRIVLERKNAATPAAP